MRGTYTITLRTADPGLLACWCWAATCGAPIKRCLMVMGSGLGGWKGCGTGCGNKTHELHTHCGGEKDSNGTVGVA
jgi:hypothetical protein